MYIEDSQVSQINKNAGEKYTAVSAECLELLERSILVSQEFDGLFDITIAPLTQLWGILPKSPMSHSRKKSIRQKHWSITATS